MRKSSSSDSNITFSSIANNPKYQAWVRSVLLSTDYHDIDNIVSYLNSGGTYT